MPPKKYEIDQSLIDDIRELKMDVKSILQRVAVLEVKAGMWGALGGSVVLMGYFVKNYFTK